LKKLIQQDSIELRLNAIIRLLSELLISQDKVTKTSVYQSLNQAGLGGAEIGKIFGKTRNEISSTFPKKDKSKSKNKKEEQDE